MRVHPAANIVPLLDGPAYAALKADIRANGQQIPIAVWTDQVLDGRNRMRACEELGIEPKIERLTSLPAGSPTMYVLSANLHRRHLTPSQLAMVGARAREHFDAEAKQRQSRRGGTADARGDARDLAGRAVGVSGKTIDYANKVLKAGVPELVAACDAGKLAVSRAARLVELPPESQCRALASRNAAVGSGSVVRRRSSAPRKAAGAEFEQFVIRAREVQALVDALAPAQALVAAGHFDPPVVLSAVRQLEAVAQAITRWTSAAREQLAGSRRRQPAQSSMHADRSTRANPC